MNSFFRYLRFLTVMLLAAVHASAQTKYEGKKVTYNDNAYDVFKVINPAQHVKMYWKAPGGAKYKSLGQLKKGLAANHKSLVFATNGGMYTVTSDPVGLYIEAGKQQHKINLKKGPTTNFYMQPNGVFYINKQAAGICISDSFSKHSSGVQYATQSGPMLVVNGKINEQFTKGSVNINIRNAVGIDKEGNAFFVITEGFVNFYDLASFFLNQLHCSNALFLDGAISRMYLPSINRKDEGGEFGVIIGVTE